MGIIFNSVKCGITKDQMKVLYRNDLIECADSTFTVATIPDWAVAEAKDLTGKEFIGSVVNESLVSEDKESVALKNRNAYPGLYESLKPDIYMSAEEVGCNFKDWLVGLGYMTMEDGLLAEPEIVDEFYVLREKCPKIFSIFEEICS